MHRVLETLSDKRRTLFRFTYTARSGSLSNANSLKPKEVVRTRGGLSCAMRKLMMSRKPPRSPSWLLFPTETNVVGTSVAIPTVYWMSRVYTDAVNTVLGSIG